MPVTRKRKAVTKKTTGTNKKKKDVQDEEKVREMQEEDDMEEKKSEEIDEDEDASDWEEDRQEETEQNEREYKGVKRKWTIKEIRRGFKPTDYNTKESPFNQKAGHKQHLSKQAAGGNTKDIPPAHVEWPVDAFKGISGVKDFKKFIHVLATNETCLEIIRNEFDVEAGTTKRSDKHFHEVRMQYYGWTGMLQIEKTFPAIMKNCQGFLTCLSHAFSQWFALKKRPFKEVVTVLEDTNTMLDAITKTVHPKAVSSIKKFVGTFYVDVKKETSYHKDMEASTKQSWTNYPRHGPLDVPDNYAKAAAGQGTKRLERYLKRPKIVEELHVTEGVRRLVQTIYGEGMDTSKKPRLEDRPEDGHTGGVLNKRVKAALCLLEVVCGSRLRGVMLVNWFSAFSSKSMHEWLAEQKNKKSPYGSWDRCIVVTRLSKEGSKATRAERESDISGKTVTEGEVRDSVIVKPLNVMFFDRTFLDAKQFKKEGKKTDKEAVDIFIDLVTVVREYIFSERIRDVHGLDPVEVGGMKGVTDTVAEQLPKTAISWTQNTTRDVGRYAKHAFRETFKEKNQGTHLLRKIYMAWSFNAFARDTMKETGYASAVLGHRGFQVSLNYTSLILKNSTVGDVTDTTLVKTKFSQLSDRIDKLTKRLDRFGKKYITIQGVEYEVLPKATKGEDPVARASKLIDMMTEDGVQWNWTRLLRLGGSTITTASTREVIEEKYLKIKKNI